MNMLDRIGPLDALAPEEAEIVKTVAEIAEKEFKPRAAGYDERNEFPWENVRLLNDIGLNGIFIPEEHGGAGLSYAAYLHCVIEISKACASTGVIWATNFHAIKPVIDFGIEEQRRRFLPTMLDGGLASLCITEPSAGSNATGMRTQFVPDGDEVVINGGKTFITSGDVADLYLVFGKWSEIDDPKRAISALIIEKGTPGLQVLRKEDKMGHRASSTATLSFDNCRVPRANLICEPGDGLRILLASLNKSRPSVAAQALGIAKAAFDDAVAYINEREQGGRKVLEFQGVQFMVADLATELALCENWLWHVARLVDSGAEDFSIEASIAKQRASDLAMRVTTDAVQLHGGYGYCRDYRVERLMRDAKLTQIWEGTNQIHRQLIGRSFLQR